MFYFKYVGYQLYNNHKKTVCFFIGLRWYRENIDYQIVRNYSVIKHKIRLAAIT